MNVIKVRHFCPNVPVILVGNKKDTRSGITVNSGSSAQESVHPFEPLSYDQGKEVAMKIGAVAYLECSAKTREVSKLTFYDL